MTTFTPPTEPGSARGDLDSADPAERLMSFYDPVQAGLTVWQDQAGAWHQNQFPYHGRPDSPGLAQAQHVFLGGHTYKISASLESALITAGFQNYLNTAPVNLTWFKQSDVSDFTEWILTADSSSVYNLAANSAENLAITLSSGTEDFRDGSRRFFIHSDTAYNTDFDATLIIDPANYGVGDIIEQEGVTLRAQQSGGKNRGITINNNIFFVVPHCNIGVWSSNTDGTGFLNRQASLGIGLLIPLPHQYDIRLIGNIVHVRVGRPGLAMPSWTDPTYAKTVNLDTDAGDPGPNPTPTGEGAAGLICAHMGTDPSVIARYRGFRVGPRGSLFGDV